MAQRLGLRVSESSGSLMVKTVLRGGLAEQAGVAAGDEWLAVDDWRIHKLDDLPQLAGRKKMVTITLSRDKRVLRRKLQLPAASSEAAHSFMLRQSAGAQPEEALRAWLGG
jgi:predicted metalloprotease with PDZ domain